MSNEFNLNTLRVRSLKISRKLYIYIYINSMVITESVYYLLIVIILTLVYDDIL